MKIAIILWLLIGWFEQPSRRLERALAPPPEPATRFRIRTDNLPQAQIAGVILHAEKRPARGTLFVCHGWGSRKEFMYGWDWVRDQLDWNIVVFDFREHGQSSHSPMICTLGFNEIWDVKAVIDHAQQQGLAEPYAICGYSLGGAVGLRWAAHDPRVKGVLAVSPYRNGLVATEQFLRGWRLPLDYSAARVYGGLRSMVETVDLPTDVKRRSDLRLWIMVGERDIFPVSDQRAILDASPSPATLKRLFVIPRAHHNNVWMWRGDAKVPSHDQIIRDFLGECE